MAIDPKYFTYIQRQRSKGAKRTPPIHIVLQGDTLCKMASTGVLNLTGYTEVGAPTPISAKVCSMCQRALERMGPN